MNCRIETNEALFAGSGMYSQGNPLFVHCRFLGNSANYNYSGDGGAIYSMGNPTFRNCLFEGNSTCEIGGAVFLENGGRFEDCIFRENSSASGGAVAGKGGHFLNCLFFQNGATAISLGNEGGAIYATGDFSFVHCTLAFNQSVEIGGGITIGGGTSSFLNCVLWGNNDQDGQDEPSQIREYGGSARIDFCDVEGLTGNLGGRRNLGLDPRFADELAGDLHLTAVSPCIGAGNGLAPGVPAFDLENDPRYPVLGVDMGSDEFARHLYVIGDPAPATTVQIKFVGEPGTAPVMLFAALEERAAPKTTPQGDWFLKDPVRRKELPPVPPYGILVMPQLLPPRPPAGGFYLLQALIGDKLTNPWRIDVK